MAEGVRGVVRGWGVEILCRIPQEYSNPVTAVVVPDGVDADAVRRAAEQRLDLSLGAGLGRLKGRGFRICHLGAPNGPEGLWTLAGTEMALAVAGVQAPVGAGAHVFERDF